MNYSQWQPATFLVRQNRFSALVRLSEDAPPIPVHVKNTGRLGELLLPGAHVYLTESQNPARKTRFDLIAVEKEGRLFNIDSLAPNTVVAEALAQGRIAGIGPVSFFRREKTFGQSRFDLYYEASHRRGFIDVKGVTLEKNGLALFPDAPTARGTKHLLELMVARQAGYEATVLFLLQFQGASAFSPHADRDPIFTDILKKASKNGVTILSYDCHVLPQSLTMASPIPVLLP